MAYTLPELQDELQALGYGGVPDHVIVSSLSKLKLDIPSDEAGGGRERPSGRRGRQPRRLHGSPVLGDREFASSRRPSAVGKALDAVCFTRDFAAEVDELREMMRVMEGAKGNLFGKASAGAAPSAPKRMGLADEHEQYVGNLMNQWRQVGRTLRPAARTEAVSRLERDLDLAGGSHRFENVDATFENWASPSTSAATTHVERYVTEESDSQAGNAVGRLDDGINVGVTLSGDGESNPRPEVGIQLPCAGTSGSAIYLDGDDEGPPGSLTAKQEVPSDISPGAPHRRCGSPYDSEAFVDRAGNSDENSSGRLTSRRDSLPSPPSSVQTPKDVLDGLSALSNDQFLAAFAESLDELDPQDMIDHETFRAVNRKIATSHVNCFRRAPVRSSESENPLESGGGAGPFLRTPDRGHRGRQSPLNDRSNIRVAEGGTTPAGKRPVKEFGAAAVTTKRSRSSREARGGEEAAEEANGGRGSDFAENRLDSRLLGKTTPPPSGRKRDKSREVFRRSLSARTSPSISRHGEGSGDASHLDATASPLVFSPAKAAKSPLNLQFREQQLPPEHRPGTCTVCPLPSHRKSPFGKGLETESGIGIAAAAAAEESPKQQRIGRSAKKRLPFRKGSGPSGIYTPLLDHKKHDMDSKVLFKASRLASASMTFASEDSRDNNEPSLRSSTESSRSSGPQRAPSSQSSKSNLSSSPYARSSSSNSLRNSRSSTPKLTLTPGGPRRAGKVDRVARFAEMQNLWKNDKFLTTGAKRKPQSFHRIFARLHVSHERYTAAYRERLPLGAVEQTIEWKHLCSMRTEAFKSGLECQHTLNMACV